MRRPVSFCCVRFKDGQEFFGIASTRADLEIRSSNSCFCERVFTLPSPFIWRLIRFQRCISCIFALQCYSEHVVIVISVSAVMGIYFLCTHLAGEPQLLLNYPPPSRPFAAAPFHATPSCRYSLYAVVSTHQGFYESRLQHPYPIGCDQSALALLHLRRPQAH